MKYEKSEGKMPIDLSEQNHPPDSRSRDQKKAGSVDGGHAAPNSPNK